MFIVFFPPSLFDNMKTNTYHSSDPNQELTGGDARATLDAPYPRRFVKCDRIFPGK